MNMLIPWIIPPMAGAVIGYVTNSMAIKMLFRPLEEKRLFGVRVPFTPGILPRQRQKLSLSIGRMVERELLTAEILWERLSQPELVNDLKNILKNSIEACAYPHAAKAVIGFLYRKDIRAMMETQLRIMVSRAVLNMNLFQRFFISAGHYDKSIEEKIPGIIDDLVIQLEKTFASEDGRKKILNAMENEVKNQLADKNPEPSLKQITESLLKTINVKTLVSERIDSLDMLRVEKMILDVLAGQLWWINVFGGILGFLIGLFQAVLSNFL